MPGSMLVLVKKLGWLECNLLARGAGLPEGGQLLTPLWPDGARKLIFQRVWIHQTQEIWQLPCPFHCVISVLYPEIGAMGDNAELEKYEGLSAVELAETRARTLLNSTKLPKDWRRQLELLLPHLAGSLRSLVRMRLGLPCPLRKDGAAGESAPLAAHLPPNPAPDLSDVGQIRSLLSAYWRDPDNGAELVSVAWGCMGPEVPRLVRKAVQDAQADVHQRSKFSHDPHWSEFCQLSQAPEYNPGRLLNLAEEFRRADP